MGRAISQKDREKFYLTKLEMESRLKKPYGLFSVKEKAELADMIWAEKERRRIKSPIARLNRIKEIIEQVDSRAMACDGPVTPTLKEITQEEMSEIYKLAKGE